jgi:hypothetical protein
VSSFFIFNFQMDELINNLLANQAKAKLKADGTNVGGWFQSLATFAGSVYRRYPSMELEGLLQYILNQLKVSKELKEEGEREGPQHNFLFIYFYIG